MAEKFLPFYNIDASVGKGGANKMEDVMLIQYFLSAVGKVPPHPIPPPSMPLIVNGIPSPLLNEWILWFQNSAKKVGQTITVDGRIDPGKRLGDSFYNGKNSIAHLNITYRKRFRDYHNALENAFDLPSQLKAKFGSIETAQQ